MKNLLLILLIISSTTVLAQFDTKPADIIPPSPTAVGLGKYGSYPVNQSTGLPSIEIPIYEIKVKGYALPIKLSYHGSGIRVSEDASWVGLGWSLFTGGSVSRTVKGLPDDKDGYLDTPYLDIDALSVLMNDNPKSFSYFEDQYMNEFEGYSSIPDIYHYSINGGGNGKFMVDKSHNVQLFPPNGTQIKERDIPNGVIGKYEITDLSGTKYVFGLGDYAHENSYMTSSAGVKNYESSWHISNISLPNNEEISFTYQEDGTIDQQNVFSQSYSISEKNCSDNLDWLHCEGYTPFVLSSTGYTNSSSMDNTEVTKIKEIVFPNGRVQFHLGATPRLDILSKNGNDLHYLSRIDIQEETSQGVYTTTESIVFNYSYFEGGSSAIPSNNKRLRLDTVTRTNLVDEPIVIASLDYSDMGLPAKDSYSTDLFGYYNGAINANHIPKHYLKTAQGSILEVGDADRTINPNKVAAASLKSITYPTKGKTEFVFEPNQYYGKPVFLDYEKETKLISLVGKGNGEQAPNPLLINDNNGVVETFCNDNFNQPCNDCCEQIETSFFIIEEQAMADFTFSRTNSNQSDEDKYSYGNITLKKDGVDILPNYQVFGGGNDTYNTSKLLALSPGNYALELRVWGDNIYASALLNYYASPKDKNRYCGGLRVKTIINKDANSSELDRVNYEYNQFEDTTKSSGKLTSTQSTVFKNTTTGYQLTTDVYAGSPLVCDYIKHSHRNFYSNALTGVNSNSVVYENVRTYKGVNTNNNGYSDAVYSFSLNQEQSIQIASLDNSWKRGELLNLKEYKTTTNDTLLVKESSSLYEDIISIKSEISGSKVFKVGDMMEAVCEFPASTHTFVYEMYIPIQVGFDAYPRIKKSDSIKEYFYDANNVLQNTVTNSSNYFYDNTEHLQLTRTETTTNNGETIINKTFYPDDVDALNSLGNDDLTQLEYDAIDKLKSVNGHRIATPIQSESYKRKADGSEELLFKKRSLYIEENGLVLPNIVQTAKTTDVLEDRLTYHKYDIKGNPLEVSQVNGTKTVYIWGHHKTLPIAKIENANFTDIVTALNITEAQVLALTESDMTLINGLRTNLPKAMVSTYTYKKLVGISSTTNPRGYTSTYHYDGFNRLQYIKDANGKILSENQYNYKTN